MGITVLKHHLKNQPKAKTHKILHQTLMVRLCPMELLSKLTVKPLPHKLKAKLIVMRAVNAASAVVASQGTGARRASPGTVTPHGLTTSTAGQPWLTRMARAAAGWPWAWSSSACR